MGLSTEITLKCFRVDGSLKWEEVLHNTLTNTGFAALAGLAGNVDSQVAFTYLALGTSSTATAATQTALVAEIADSGLTRVAATVSRETTTVTNDTLQLLNTWTASGSKSIEEIGIFNASSAGVMLGRALTTTKAIVSGETIQGTYKVKIAAV